MSFVIRREIDVESKIADILSKFIGKKFHNAGIAGVVRQYDRGLEGRRADIAVIKDDGMPLLLIETKKKYETRGFRVERRFIVTSEEVLGQVFSYAAILKRSGIYVPFVATANDKQIAVFLVPEDIDKQVDWDAVQRRDYGHVLSKNYIHETLRAKYLILHKQIRFAEDFFDEILDTITGIYAGGYGVEKKKQELHWVLIEDLRGFVDFLTPFIYDAIAPGGKFRDDVAKLVQDYVKSRGYSPSPEQLAREMAYVLLNKMVFYKVLERHYEIEPLKPFYREGIVKTVSQYLGKLNELFSKAIEKTQNFEPVFHTGIYDNIDIVESEEVLKAFDWLIELIDAYRIERFGDIIGYVYEDLILDEERHAFGQFYTSKPIAELIVKWCIKTPDDRVLDPGCGSGTFLIDAYKRLAELKLKKGFSEIKYVPGDVHKQILSQLVGIDINEFPAHLTAMNLAMRNPKAPSTDLNIVVDDYFNIVPAQKSLLPYRVKRVEGEKQAEIIFKDFDVIVGNPPYTRWTEIPKPTQDRILKLYENVIRQYDLTPQVARGVEPGIYTYWIIHSTSFLKEGGRLGMIISDSWLQADYGRGFFKYLLDHYKLYAVIDISARVFPVPLIGACIVLLEKCSNPSDRGDNKTVFMYLDVSKGYLEVDRVLELLDKSKGSSNASFEHVFPSGARALVRVYRQSELLKYEGRLVNLLFGADDILNKLEKHHLVAKLSTYFEPSFGNIMYVYLATVGKVRGVRNVGGEEFYYLTEEKAKRYGIPKEYLHSLLPSSDYMKFFTFTRDDWETIRRNDVECYLFLAYKPRNQLPESVRRYIELGEKDADQGGIALTKSKNKGKAVVKSLAAQTRRKYMQYFYDWYDLGGVIEAPIYVARGAQYWMRFVLSKFNCALDDRILALIPRQGVAFDELELKALLAFLNSSFSQLQAEVRGRSTGGGMIELDVKPLSEFLILDVKKLPRDDAEKLAKLFDKLENETRRLGGADTAENVYGSELAKELTGKDVERKVDGIFNTIIKEIDYEIGRILGVENMVEIIRTLVIEHARRRLSRVLAPKQSALKGSEPIAELRPEKTKRKSKSGSTSLTTTLDEWLKPGGGQ